MMMLLQGKSVFITGGSKGIGRAIVHESLLHGATYVCYYSQSKSADHERLEEVAQKHNATLMHIQGSVTDEAGIIAAVNTVVKEAGALDVVVNNAGITQDKLIIGMNSDDWDQVIDINLKGVFLVSKTVVPFMLKQRTGSIVNITSLVGITGNPGQTNYAASKAGVIGFTKSLAREVAKRGIRVNAIAPGFIKTDMTDKIKEEYQRKLLERIPMGYIGQPNDVARPCVFLSSDMGNYITGQVLIVSGGMEG